MEQLQAEEPLLQEETEQHINPAGDQEVDPEAIHRFLDKATDPVLCQIDPETIADNFEQNLIQQPSESSWDTTPTASAIQFFGGMADERTKKKIPGR